MNHSRPELSNAIRDLSKCIDKSDTSYYKDLLHAIKYVIYTIDYWYRMKPDENLNVQWELHGYSDADYSEDNDNHKRVKVYTVLLNGAVVAWSLLSQKTVTLSVYRILIFRNHRSMLQNNICLCYFSFW